MLQVRDEYYTHEYVTALEGVHLTVEASRLCVLRRMKKQRASKLQCTLVANAQENL